MRNSENVRSVKNWMLFLAATLFFSVPCRAQNAPRIAVFDPQTSTIGIHMDVDEMNAVAATLQKAGLSVARVTTAQIDMPDAFGADKFDVLVMRGDNVPRENFPEIQKFASAGGILVALAAKAPFNHGVAQKSGGQWGYSPEAPKFSWQTDDVSDVFGFRYIYRPALIDAGVRHTSTPLWKRYLPQATDWSGVLPSIWVVPASGGTFYPLIRSRRGDGQDVSPQIYIARKENRSAVVSTADLWTKGGPEWAFGPQTTVALVQIALDLHSGALKLTDADKIDLPADLAASEPLTSRVPIGQVDPDGAPVVTRWGKFDGSGVELSDTTALPRVLKAGSTITLPLTSNGKPLWLRVRGAVAESGAVLKVAMGKDVLWNESISYLDVGKVGNFGNTDLSGIALEFNRRVFLPPTKARVLTLSNPGAKPLYFDAAQLENAPVKPVTWMTGMGASYNQFSLKGRVNLPRERTSEWSGIRGTVWAKDVKAPGTPDRWAIIDKRIQGYLATGAPLELLIEGTPEWAAISPERYRAAVRKSDVPPDAEKYREIVEYLLHNYADKTDLYEIWNEVDSQAYWIGNASEYITLWKTIVPMIRREDPTARVMISGLTGFSPPFLHDIIAAGMTKEADMIGFHPYSGNEAAWDKTYTTIQGQLYAQGQNIEIYCNEMGFPASPTDWFTPAPFPYTPITQGRMTEVALSRLLANGSAKFSLFYGGGDDGGNNYIDGHGQPYPGYVVLQDYFPLAKNGGTRCDISMARADGVPQRGVYLAGAQYHDGSIRVVINPAEVVPPKYDAPADTPAPVISVPLALRVPLAGAGDWKASIDGSTLPVKVRTSQGQSWGEIVFTLRKRAVLTVTR